MTSARFTTLLFTRGQRRIEPYLGDGGFSQLNSFGRSLSPVLDNPGTLLPDIGDFHQVGIDAYLLTQLRKVTSCIRGEQEQTTIRSR